MSFLIMSLVAGVIILFAAITILSKLPVQFKALMYKVPIWLLSIIIDIIILVPASGFLFGVVAALVSEPILYGLLIWDYKRTNKYIQHSLNKYGKILSKAQMRKEDESIREKTVKEKADKSKSDTKWNGKKIDWVAFLLGK